MKKIIAIISFMGLFCSASIHAQQLPFAPKSFSQSMQPTLLSGNHNLSGDVQVAWVQHYASRHLPSQDQAVAMVVDPLSGEVYVTGYSSNQPMGMDYVTVKYDAAGKPLWTARYDGDGHGDDIPAAISLDGAGNVYVTGKSLGANTNFDYATIKYDRSGRWFWTARYNGSENAADAATALALDAAGNVYVTGKSFFSRNRTYYTTIKYNARGADQWMARYDSVGISREALPAIALDRSNNIYLAGTLDDGYVIIKYNSAGVKRWQAVYERSLYREQVKALAVDAAGNVYITGKSMTPSRGAHDDYATVKYDSAGSRQWVATYDGPAQAEDIPEALVVDGSGNVYVTGASASDRRSECATIKYNSAGQQQWVVRYNNPSNNHSGGLALAVDHAGYIYVAGYSNNAMAKSDYVTIKYNGAGAQQWVAIHTDPAKASVRPVALAVSASGNVYVTGATLGGPDSNDYVTAKYSAAGTEQWVSRFNGAGNSNDRANALALDSDGNIYVAGGSWGKSDDYVTIKYGETGAAQWTNPYKGPLEELNDQATAMAVDAMGNIYLTGNSPGVFKDNDYLTIKYNPAGGLQWSVRYNGPGKTGDFAKAIHVDLSGNVYVSGNSGGDFATIKYNSNGVQQWVARYNSPADSTDMAVAIAVDHMSNVYVTGSSIGAGTANDYVTIKYNQAGIQEWAARYNGPGNSHDYPMAIGLDNAGNVYVTGSSLGVNTSDDYATIKYDQAGNEKWAVRYNGPGNYIDKATALVVESTPNGTNVFVTGVSKEDEALNDITVYATIKYNAEGTPQWIAKYTGAPGRGWNKPSAMILDDWGNIYVTGFSGGIAYDYATVKYNPAGVQEWEAIYDGPGHTSDYATALAADPAGNIYVTGMSKSSDSAIEEWSMFTTIKYVQTVVSVQDQQSNTPVAYSLSQNYPNPFSQIPRFAGNPSTRIHYTLPKSGHVTLKIFDLLGREVATLVNDMKMAGEHDVQWKPPVGLTSGVYVYRLEAGNFVDTKKLVLMQ